MTTFNNLCLYLLDNHDTAVILAYVNVLGILLLIGIFIPSPQLLELPYLLGLGLLAVFTSVIWNGWRMGNSMGNSN